MRAVLVVGLAMTACYSARAVPGTPCTPELANCPDGLACTLVAGQHVCTDGSAPDATAIDASEGDGGGGIDGDTSPDAPRTRWTLVHTAGAMGVDVTIAASGAGHLVVVAIETDDLDPVDAVTDTAGNVYAPIAGSRGENDAENRGIELWFAANSQAGATKVTATGSMVFAVVVWEVAGIDLVAPLDTATHADDQAASTLPVGASITTANVGEFVVSVAIVDNTVSGIHPGNEFTDDQVTFGNGWAHLTSPDAPAGPHQARWDQPIAGTACAASAAFRTAP